MRPRIIAVDYDGTLEQDGAMNSRLIETLRHEQSKGSIVILWTCREGKRLRDAVSRLREAGLSPDCVNRNSVVGVRLMGHDSRKVFADVYIDDKGAR